MTGRIHSQAGTKQSYSSSTKGTALPSSKAFAISLCARQRCTIWRAFFFYLSLNWTSLFLFKKPGKTSFIIILLFQFCRIMYTKEIPIKSLGKAEVFFISVASPVFSENPQKSHQKSQIYRTPLTETIHQNN